MKNVFITLCLLAQSALPSFSQTLEEALAQQAAEWASLRAKALPTEAASKVCEIIAESKSPNGQYAFGITAETTCLVDLKADKVLAWSAVAHYGPEQAYNHNSHEVLWSADSTQVLQMEQGKWETQQAEAFRIFKGKAVWLGDVRTALIAAAEAKAKSDPLFEGVITVSAAKFGKKDTLTGTGMTQTPKGDGGGDISFSGTFSEKGKFNVTSLQAKP